MRFLAVLNSTGGTLRTMDLTAFQERSRQVLTTAGHSVEFRTVKGEKIVPALEEAAKGTGHDVILVGGGDGTVSAAAGLLAGSDKALAILPAGTMNLFARSLGIPLDLDAAIAGFAAGHFRQVDIASANGRRFVHQYSIGIHPEVIDLRSRMQFGSRLGKLVASGRAAAMAVLRPPHMRVSLSMGDTEVIAVSSSISVTNNLFGEGHLPFADRPDGGVLGIYITRARTGADFVSFFLNMAIGRWEGNEQVEIHETDMVTLRILSHHRRFKCALDGELCPLDKETVLRIHPGALRVLVPGSSPGN